MVMAAEICRVANEVEVQRKIYGFCKPNTQLLYVTFQETETPLATTATTIATTSTTTVTTTTTPVSTVSTGGSHSVYAYIIFQRQCPRASRGSLAVPRRNWRRLCFLSLVHIPILFYHWCIIICRSDSYHW